METNDESPYETEIREEILMGWPEAAVHIGSSLAIAMGFIGVAWAIAWALKD